MQCVFKPLERERSYALCIGQNGGQGAKVLMHICEKKLPKITKSPLLYQFGHTNLATYARST